MLVDERSAEAVAASIRESDRLGLLSRPDRESPHRFHPLVRDFLVARLTAEIGEEAVRELHRTIAEALRSSRWFAAAWHFREAGDAASAAEMVDASVSSVLAAGLLEQTRQFLDGSAGSIHRADALILRSRLELERGNLARAIDLAQQASDLTQNTDKAGLALLSLTAILARHGFDGRSVELASRALGGNLSPAERQVAEATVAVSSTQVEGDMAAVADFLSELAVVQDAAGHIRYAGVTRLNLAGILLWQGKPHEAGRIAARAEVDLGSSSSSPERVAASAVRAAALIQLGHVEELDRLGAWSSRPPHRQPATRQQLRRPGCSGTTDRWRWPRRPQPGSGTPPWPPDTEVPGPSQPRPWRSVEATQWPRRIGSRWPTTRCMMRPGSSAWALRRPGSCSQAALSLRMSELRILLGLPMHKARGWKNCLSSCWADSVTTE